ncbi:hypothetical protein KC19_9G109300 [Ceratodon purpureus]|uniref:LIM zinc-binding domain-containing protein n=2 Tax=Ceratodon purpureus TaxID=3225 RepID=A0A8T0GUG7_CERPU|nr:hypothetical protein KC19_9G109300 [Ceratodon purpureus]KAG0562000.1 hypothetical protein KC19_9G109300 [Ceratodon purpureus]
MGWLDSFFGSGAADQRRYGENEVYEYPRYGSSSLHGGGSGGWQGGGWQGPSSGGWQGPNIFEDPYANVYSSHGGGYPYQDSGRSSYQDSGRSSYRDISPSYQSSGRSYQDGGHPAYGYMGPGFSGYPQYSGSSEPSYPARRSIEEDRQSSKGAASDDDESEDDEDGESGEVEELSSGLQVLGLRYPSPQVTSVTAPYHPNTMSASRFEGMKTCAGCGESLGYGKHLTTLGRDWHPSCFCCGSCNKVIVDREFSVQGNAPYHRECYKKNFHPKCQICHNFIPPNSEGLIEYRSHPFWDQKYCPSHERDGRRRCCSCDRIETVDEQYTSLGDGRKVCSICLETNVMDTRDCQPLYRDILKFYKQQLGMPIDQEIPMLLVKREALNNAREAEKDEHMHAPETRGLCLSEEQTITTVYGSSPDEYGGYPHHETESRKLTRHCEVTAILVLFGLPKLLTGSILAHELMHAWIRLDGKFPNLANEIEEGICQVIAHIWLTQEMDKLKKKGASSATKELAEFFKHQIETDSSPVYGDGYRAAQASVQVYGLRRTLDHLRDTGRLLH